MLAGMDLKDLDIKFVDGPKSAPGTVVQKVTVTMTSKTTGKTTPGPVTDILVWEFDESHKVKYGKIYFGAPDNLAYVLDKDAPSVTPQPVMPVPPPEMTSEKALAAFGKIYGAWGTGAFNNPETKAAAQAEMWTEDIVMDVTAAALSPAENPGIYRLLHGFKGGDQWVNDVIGEWEMSGLDMSGEGAFASPTPGAAMHREPAPCENAASMPTVSASPRLGVFSKVRNRSLTHSVESTLRSSLIWSTFSCF